MEPKSQENSLILFDIKEACEFLGVSRTSLHRYVKQGRVIPIKMGGSVRFQRSDLLDFLEKAKISRETLIVPKISSFTYADQLLALTSRARSSPCSTLVFDFSKSTFITPFGVSILCSAVNELKFGKAKIEFIKPQNDEIKMFLDQIGFWQCLDLRPSFGSSASSPIQPNIQLRRFSAVSAALIDELVNFFSSSMNLSPGVSSILRLAHNELLENVFDHSLSPDGCLVCATSAPTSKKLKLTVLDEGQGIKSSLHKNPNFKPKDDIEAIKLSVKKWVGAEKDQDRGLGLNTLLKFIKLNGGELRIATGRGKVSFRDFDDCTEEQLTNYLQGTIVEVSLNMDQDSRYQLKGEEDFIL